MDEEFDFVIVGSGAGSVPAALVMADREKSVVILEKLSSFGGTSTYSGGVIWIPDNPVTNADGSSDSVEQARCYMIAAAGDSAAEVAPERRDAFIRGGREAVQFLIEKGMTFVDAHWPDYHDELPGGRASGRSLEAPIFDVNALGDWAPKLAQYRLTTDIPVRSSETVHLFLAKKMWRGRIIAARIAWRMLVKKLLRKDLRGAGPALMGRLFQLLLGRNIPIRLEVAVRDFIVEDGRVTGVISDCDGREVRVRARLGVLVNAGGFARNLAMRERYQPKPTSVDWTQVNPGDTGDLIEAAARIGAATQFMDESWWLPSTYFPDGSFGGFHSPNDISKPHSIVVDAKGRRFVNESCGYTEFGQAMYAAGAVPAWAILDIRHRKTYPWGSVLPGTPPQKLIDNGYFKRAETLDDLARQCGIDAEGLKQTVARFNGFAATGVDEDFHRGESAYNNYYRDPTVKPNPNLGAIDKGPFYAAAIYPGDVGTAGGIVADEHGRALREDGSVIPGLYVTGNSSAAVTGRCYPGAGSSVGPSLVFGYVAARHAVGANA
jgi:3-oxosteroid 1-dehydrogenase